MKTYLITKDVVETLTHKLGYDLGNETKQQVKELESDFVSALWQYIPDALEHVALSSEQLSAELQGQLSSDLPVVSMDRVYVPHADAYIDATRATDPITGQTMIMERSGAAPLNEQLQALHSYDRIQIVDVGVFAGETIRGIHETIQEHTQIDSILVACANTPALNALQQDMPLRALHTFDFYDWVELRDFFGIDGRVVEGGERTFIPYWENLVDWATIPPNHEKEVATLCKNYYGKLCTLLQYDGHDPSLIGKHIKYSAK